MSQNMISLELSADEWTGVDGALDTLERLFIGLVSLTPEQRMRMVKMGDKSEAFCRQALDVMGENTTVLPRNLDLAEVRRDLATHDALRPRLVRMTRLLEKANDTDLALGSDVMSAALEGYAFLKIAGKGEGLHGLRKTLSHRFDNTTRKVTGSSPVPESA
jgi:hypothetical protein